MSTKEDGGSAFPEILTDDAGYLQYVGGMSLRDWFAGMALQGLLAGGGAFCPVESVAGAAYERADAMLKARKK